MVDLRLVQASPDNGLMKRLIAEWDRQIVAQRYPKEVLDAIRRYEAELKPDKTYGVYVLCRQGEGGIGHSPYEAFVHINHAHPKSNKPILRLIWSRLAPKYEWVADPVEEHSRIFSSVVYSAAELAKNDLKSSEVKIYLLSRADRSFGKRFATALTGATLPFTVSARGNWLHLAMRNEQS